MEQNVQVQAKPIKIPGPDHPISIERDSERVIVAVAGRDCDDLTAAGHTTHRPCDGARHLRPRLVRSASTNWVGAARPALAPNCLAPLAAGATPRTLVPRSTAADGHFQA